LKKTILIVEDDSSISSSLKEFLEDNDFSVLTAPNGEVALNVLKASKKPSLILLDLMMPIMDGFAFRENQLSDEELKDIPVIIMSADGHVAEKKIKTSAVDYIKKPLDIFNLLEVIAKVMV
jgi:CheY-like chemotaxis protein